LRSAVDNPSREASAAAPAAPSAVAIRNVHKSFRLPHQQYMTLKERALHPFRSRTFDELHALQAVSLEIPAGEFFGIVGRNGSGKSTLLKCLAGIYEIDSGDVEVHGRLAPFIELGVGFNPELTARENVVINAIMLGLTRRQARERFGDIIAFAELEEFVDLKLKNYSSGMHVRLAFSIAIQADADILLVDEVLAVGDAAFQQKCFDAFTSLKASGRTIVFVTHDMRAVEHFCDRAMLIERGRVQSIGDPYAIARAYNELNFGKVLHGAAAPTDHGAAEILACWFETSGGEAVTSLEQGQPLAICMDVRFHTPLEQPVFAISLRNKMRHTIFATSTRWVGPATGDFAPGDEVRVRIAVENWLAPSRYTATPSIARADAREEAIDVREDLASLILHGERQTGGIADLPHTIEIERT
jgi:ABC-type polysaccharide/polyol phosphate transport system ATPase subunit